MTRRTVLSIATAALLVSWGGAAVAGPPAGSKRPAAGKVFRQVWRNFKKAKSYEVSVKIEGGISGTPDHAIKTRTVNENYSGEVYGSLMHHPAMPRAFRTPKSGAIFTGTGWKNILADRQGVRLDRLFSFPQTLFDRAGRYVRFAEWVESASGSEEEKPAEIKLVGDEKEADEEKAAGKEKGRTVVKSSGKKEDVDLPRFIRIETPPKEALKHFIEVENSGCMSVG